MQSTSCLLGALMAALVGLSATPSPAAEQMVGVVPSDGVAMLVKQFPVAAGTTILGMEFRTNDATTVFPDVQLVHDCATSISDGTVVAEVADAGETADGWVRVLLADSIQVTESADYAVAVRIPQGDGKQGPGDGPALGATDPISPNRSFLASGTAGELTPIAVDLVINLLTQGGPGKAAAEQSSAPTDAGAAILPLRTYLGNVPSPTRTATIEFGLERPKLVMLNIYNVAGRRVRTLVHRTVPAGVHLQHWDGRDQDGRTVAAGVYIVRLRADGTDITRKLVLAR